MRRAFESIRRVALRNMLVLFVGEIGSRFHVYDTDGVEERWADQTPPNINALLEGVRLCLLVFSSGTATNTQTRIIL